MVAKTKGYLRQFVPDCLKPYEERYPYLFWFTVLNMSPIIPHALIWPTVVAYFGL